MPRKPGPRLRQLSAPYPRDAARCEAAGALPFRDLFDGGIAGHVPGAISAPAAANLTDDDYFAYPRTLQRHFTGLGVSKDREVVVFCGSGVSATHNLAALA
ncbi:rhodanese-like domain-containing protein [Novosphingobium chloroacetimidivorans]|uniref:rhodanese-like domain-containing protein n=1 Tax=Novosphingobium chloroacetimidivorans TaxID=1428314 RepID=UPI0035E416B1